MKELFEINDYTYNTYSKRFDEKDHLYARIYGYSSHGEIEDKRLSKYVVIAPDMDGYSVVRNRKKYWGVIDKDDNEVLPCLFNYVKQFDSNLYAIKNEEGNYAFINIDGKILTGYNYCDIKSEFKEGLLGVAKRYDKKDDSKYYWGFIDKNGEEVIPCRYPKVKDFSEGYAAVLVNTDNTRRGMKYGFIDKDNNMVIKPQFDAAFDFQCGRALITSLDDNKYGFIDKTGKVVIPIKYYNANSFNDGLASVQLNKGKNCGYINTEGKLVIPYKFISASDFAFGYARVYSKFGRYYIDKNGNRVPNIRIIYDMKDGLRRIKNMEGKYGFINESGTIIIPCEYDKAHNFQDGMAAVQQDEQWGYINKEGRVIVPIKYDFPTDYIDGVGRVYDPENDYAFRFFDREGNPLEGNIYCSDITTPEGTIHLESTSKKGLAHKKAAVLEEIREKYTNYIDNNVNRILQF